MSSRRSSSTMGPPPDRDVVMGPPPVPTPQPQQGTQYQKPKDPQEVTEKYRKLKRRYFELEEKHKEAATELQRSGERNVKMRGERDILLDRIMELESQTASNISNGSSSQASSQSGAFPKALLNARARNTFTTNLRQAMSEEDVDDPVDPLLSSRHVGPAARKRAEDERKDRQDEEARDLRRSQRSRKTQTSYPAGAHQVISSHKGKDVAGPSSKQAILNYPPGPPHGDPNSGALSSTSSKGRLRIKPPHPPEIPHTPEEHIPMPPYLAQQQLYSFPPPPIQQHIRSQSPISPMVSPPDESLRPNNYSPTQYRNGNGGPPNNGHGHSPTLIRRDSSSSHVSNSPTITQHQGQYSPPHDMQHPTMIAGAGNARGSDFQRHAKPKRLKAHTVTTKSFSIPMVPRDKKGRPMLPLNVGIMTVISLGDVCMREHFHTERYIFPVGYEVTRRYLSTVDPINEVVYNCTILDGGDGPKFQIVPSDAPEHTVIAGTATGAWSNIVRQANGIRHRQHSNSVSGPDFFGLGQNTIKHLIQELGGADRLRDYVWQNFVEGGPLGGRHAAVMPALPEELDPNNQTRDHRRRPSVTDKEEPLSPSLQTPSQQHLQPGLTTIVLPPPTTSETLNIHEYQPPPEKRMTRGRAAAHSGHSESPGPAAPHRSPSMRTRAVSRNEQRADSQSTSVQPPQAPGSNHSPYIVHRPSSPPPVPATFASIMNAYPGPDSGPGSGNGRLHANGNASGSVSNAGSE